MDRRKLLEVLGAAGISIGMAGCGGSRNNTDQGTTDSRDSTSTVTPSPTGSPTPVDQAPQITDATAELNPEENSLYYSVTATDQKGLGQLRVVYGEKEYSQQPEGKEATVEGTFEDVAEADPSEAGRVSFRAVDSAGQETRKDVVFDSEPPEVVFETRTTENAKEISYNVEAVDNRDLVSLKIEVGTRTLIDEDLNGKEASLEGLVEQNLTPGKMNRLTATVQDTAGNQTSKKVEQYARKFDKTGDLDMDIAVDYIPWIGDKFGGILRKGEVRPNVGHYEDFAKGPQNEVANNHIDQMLGFGANKLLFGFGENRRDYDRFENFKQSELFDKIDLDIFYVLPQVFKRNRNLDDDMDFIRENIFTEDNYNTVNGRPVVHVWRPSDMIYNDALNEQITNEYGGLKGFYEYVSSKLTVDGTEPFLVGDANGRGYPKRIYPGSIWQQEDFWKLWDGLTTFAGRLRPGMKQPWSEYREVIRRDYVGIHEFVNKHQQEFWPMVMPGFNDTHQDGGWGQDRRISRAVEDFRQNLQLAAKYATGRINIYSFNEWAEGSQIESGEFLGNNYDTSYLEAIRQF